MMTVRYRAWMIIGVAFSFIVSAWLIASFSELFLRDGPVQYVAAALFASSAVVGSVGLVWFLRVALNEWSHYHERNKDLVSIEKEERVLVRRGTKPGDIGILDESGIKPILVIPARHKRAVYLDPARFDPELYQRLVRGGDPHERKSSG